jgi:predicted nucleotidyltransferase
VELVVFREILLCFGIAGRCAAMSDSIEAKACGVLRLYPVKRAALFGSAARGEITEQSDVDMVVEFLSGARGILFFGLHADLEDVLARHVDLITYDALEREAEPRFRDNVLRDERIIYERENENNFRTYA